MKGKPFKLAKVRRYRVRVQRVHVWVFDVEAENGDTARRAGIDRAQLVAPHDAIWQASCQWLKGGKHE